MKFVITIKKYLIVFCIFLFSLTTKATSYYVSTTGSDTNNGLSENTPFLTITKVNSLTLIAGDKVLFKRGDTFVGQLIISHSGTNGSPIIYDSYGTGALPILSGSNGSNGVADPLSTIDILDQEYLEFHNLHIENERFDADPNADDDKSIGILIRSNKTMPLSNNFEDETLSKYFKIYHILPIPQIVEFIYNGCKQINK